LQEPLDPTKPQTPKKKTTTTAAAAAGEERKNRTEQKQRGTIKIPR